MFRFMVLLVSLVGIISCSDSGTGPESYEPSEFFPLLSGAQWHYSLLYTSGSQANSAGGIMNHREFGSLTLSVTDELDNGKFLVNVDFSIDSLHHSYQSDVQGYPMPGDTAYTQYSVYDTSFNCIFTADKEHVYYGLSGTEKALYSYNKGTYQDIDLSLFDLGRYESFDQPMKYQGVQSSKYVYRAWGEPMTQGYDTWNTEAAFDLLGGGLVRVGFSSCTNCGGLSNSESSVSFNLVAFNPGGGE